MGMEHMKRHVRDALNLSANSRRLIRALKFIRATELRDGGSAALAAGGSSPIGGSGSALPNVANTAQTQFLYHLLWYAAHEAAELGLIR